MTYLVCQTSRCQQTYPIHQFEPTDTNIPCAKCGGVLIDKNGRANLSQHPTVIPVITAEELTASNKKRLASKREEMAELRTEIQDIEEEMGVGRDIKTTTHYMYTCESGCGHTTTVDRFYKTKRVFCGVCGEKSEMSYQGECTVSLKTPTSAFSLTH